MKCYHSILYLALVLSQLTVYAAETSTESTEPISSTALEKIGKMTPIFDQITLAGWIQAPPYATSISRDDITDLAALATKLTMKSDILSAYVSNQIEESLKVELAAYSSSSTNSKSLSSALARNLNKIVSGSSLYEVDRFQGVQLRAETNGLLKKKPQGEALARLNRLLLEDAFPAELASSPFASWMVKDRAMASLGAGRGVIYTEREFTNYRLVFTMRHVSGKPDHQACFLIFCTAPPEGEKGRDALAGIQFQPPNGGHWDYRPGKNNGGKDLFTRLVNPQFDPHEWSQVEILVDADTGTARMAVAQPVGTKAIEVLRFSDPTAGKKGPIAWQMHNKGLFDEYKDVRIELDPEENGLITLN